MRHAIASGVGVLCLGGATLAQTDDIRQLERQYIDARRNGSGLAALHADDYFDVIPPGTSRAAGDISGLAANPKYGGNPDIQIRMFGEAALVTGLLDGPQGNGRDRYLRVWIRENGQWRAAAYHGTWLGNERARAAAPLLQEPDDVVFGYQPGDAVERAIWAQHEALEQASAAGDRASYRALTTSDFMRVANDGQAYTREEWLARPTTPAAPARQAHVRLRVYGDLALLGYLNVGSGADSPSGRRPVTWTTRIFARQEDGSWKAVLTQSTPARQPGS